MYEDMYKDYSGKCLPYSYPISFDLRNKSYLWLNEPIRVKWYYGDYVPMTFKLCDKDPDDEQSIPEYLENKTIELTFYNFRKEEVLNVEFVPNDVLSDEEVYYIEYTIDSETSAKLFSRGIYYCGMTLVDENNDVETILYYNKCPIEVL